MEKRSLPNMINIESISSESDFSANTWAPKEDQQITDFSILLHDSFGNEVKTGKSQEGKLSLDVSLVPNGLYFLRMEVDSQIKTKQVLIKHWT